MSLSSLSLSRSSSSASAPHFARALAAGLSARSAFGSLLLLLSCAASQQTSAATLYWDGNSTTAGAGNTTALLNREWGTFSVWNSDAAGVTDTFTALSAIRARTPALLVCTRGALGCSVFRGAIPAQLEEGQLAPPFAVEVFNVLGAGDAFLQRQAIL